jgi:hypothetical protein
VCFSNICGVDFGICVCLYYLKGKRMRKRKLFDVICSLWVFGWHFFFSNLKCGLLCGIVFIFGRGEGEENSNLWEV